MLSGIGVVVVVALLFVLSGLKVLNEYERVVVFRLGRLTPYRGPGVVFIIPILERQVRIDLRTVTLEIPPQDVITRDNVTVKVSAVLYFRVIDPSRAVTEVRDYLFATFQLSQTTLRSVGGQTELDDLLGQREKGEHEDPGDHRPADRAVGHQGQAGRAQEHRSAAGYAARDRGAGRGRA